jgi:predicted nucleotidyltransferase
MSFKEKYFYYKLKYLELKNQIGGKIIKKDEIINSIEMKKIFEQYKNLKGVVLYGSVARGQNTESSDIDFMLVWKKYGNIVNDMTDIESSLKKIFNKEIELVSIRFNEKNFTKIDYIDNVCTEGIVIYGSVYSMGSEACEIYNFNENDKIKLKDIKRM